MHLNTAWQLGHLSANWLFVCSDTWLIHLNSLLFLIIVAHSNYLTVLMTDHNIYHYTKVFKFISVNTYSIYIKEYILIKKITSVKGSWCIIPSPSFVLSLRWAAAAQYFIILPAVTVGERDVTMISTTVRKQKTKHLTASSLGLSAGKVGPSYGNTDTMDDDWPALPPELPYICKIYLPKQKENAFCEHKRVSH